MTTVRSVLVRSRLPIAARWPWVALVVLFDPVSPILCDLLRLRPELRASIERAQWRGLDSCGVTVLSLVSREAELRKVHSLRPVACDCPLHPVQHVARSHARLRRALDSHFVQPISALSPHSQSHAQYHSQSAHAHAQCPTGWDSARLDSRRKVHDRIHSMRVDDAHEAKAVRFDAIEIDCVDWRCCCGCCVAVDVAIGAMIACLLDSHGEASASLRPHWYSVQWLDPRRLCRRSPQKLQIVIGVAQFAMAKTVDGAAAVID